MPHFDRACCRPRNNEIISHGCMGGTNYSALSTDTSLHKKISKKKSSWCRDEPVNALAEKAHKQGMPHSDAHSIACPHYSTTIPTYVAVPRQSELFILLLYLYCYCYYLYCTRKISQLLSSPCGDTLTFKVCRFLILKRRCVLLRERV